MTNVISRTAAIFSSLLNSLQVKRFFALVTVGFLLLTTNANPDFRNQELTRQVRQESHQINDSRPKTTGEWKDEARKDVPLNQRVQQIGEQSADAFKEFGSGYVKGAQKTAHQAKDGLSRAGQDLVD